MGAKSKLGVSERREIVLSLLRREEPAGVLARRYAVSENTLYRWRDEFVTAGEAALANGKGKAIGIPRRQGWAKAAKEKLDRLMTEDAA